MLRRVMAPLVAAVCGGAALLGATAGPATAATAYRDDFRVPGVIIWSQSDGGSTRVGLGYPGQGFDRDDNFSTGSLYTCDNKWSTIRWAHGRDAATGVVGWVPACNLASY